MSFWGTPLISICIKWEKKLQRRACKNVPGKEYVSLEESLKTLNILSFGKIVFINKAKMMYKVANTIGPIYLTQFFSNEREH